MSSQYGYNLETTIGEILMGGRKKKDKKPVPSMEPVQHIEAADAQSAPRDAADAQIKDVIPVMPPAQASSRSTAPHPRSVADPIPTRIEPATPPSALPSASPKVIGALCAPPKAKKLTHAQLLTMAHEHKLQVCTQRIQPDGTKKYRTKKSGDLQADLIAAGVKF